MGGSERGSTVAAMRGSPRSNFLSALLGAGVVAVVFAVLALSGTFDGDAKTTTVSVPASDGTPPATTTQAAPAPSTGGGRATDVSALYDRVRDGVVYIQVSTRTSGAFGGSGEEQPTASGSGFVLDDQGHILTNDHVVEGSDRVQVRVGASQSLISAKVAGTDPSADLAVVTVDPADVKGGLKPLALGSSAGVRVGQPAIAIGSPFGLQGTLTTGVISALGRTIPAPNNFQISGALQTDAAINPGNSGGPLLDAAGEVIGINAQIETNNSSGGTGSNSGVGFAIPIDTAKQAIPALERGERIRRAYLGVETGDGTSGGAVVARVVSGGPADKAGLKEGDEIVSVGGKAVPSSEDVASAIVADKPGDVVPVVVERGGDRRTFKVTLGTQPKTAGG
jgi:S1-C subfamily serine protease